MTPRCILHLETYCGPVEVWTSAQLDTASMDLLLEALGIMRREIMKRECADRPCTTATINPGEEP